MTLEFAGEFDRLLDQDNERPPFCSRCGMKIEDIFELASGLCWICEQKPKPPEPNSHEPQ